MSELSTSTDAPPDDAMAKGQEQAESGLDQLQAYPQENAVEGPPGVSPELTEALSRENLVDSVDEPATDPVDDTDQASKVPGAGDSADDPDGDSANGAHIDRGLDKGIPGANTADEAAKQRKIEQEDLGTQPRPLPAPEVAQPLNIEEVDPSALQKPLETPQIPKDNGHRR